MRHYVVTRKEIHYPFRCLWGCVCGRSLRSTVMGPELYREFKEHEEKR